MSDLSEERINQLAQGIRRTAGVYLRATDPGARVEAAGIFCRFNPGDVTGEEDDAGLILMGHALSSLGGIRNPWRRLNGCFLIAVTRDKVHALNYGGFEKLEITGDIAAFDRETVWLRTSPSSENNYYESAGHRVPLDGGSVDSHPGAADVVAALARENGDEAAGLSE